MRHYITSEREREVVGYMSPDGCCYCVDCAADVPHRNQGGLAPIFATSEWDMYPVCDECGCAITDVSLIGQSDAGEQN
jgi:hypothetical protein